MTNEDWTTLWKAQFTSNSNNIILIQGQCLTLDGNEPGKPCQLPYFYGSLTNGGCRNGSGELPSALFPNQTNRLWCPTEIAPAGSTGPKGGVTYEDQPKKGKWGFCSERCPTSHGTEDLCYRTLIINYHNGEVSIYEDISCSTRADYVYHDFYDDKEDQKDDDE